MNKVLIGLLALSSISALAKNDKVPSLHEVLSKQTCNVTIANHPIDFEKNSNIARSGQVYIGSFLKNLDKVRRLDVGRSLAITGIASFKSEIRVKDPSISYFCADYKEGATIDCDDMTSLTIAEIEQLSDFNLKFNCTKDDVVLF